MKSFLLSIAIYGAIVLAYLYWSPLSLESYRPDIVKLGYLAIGLALWAVAFLRFGGRYVKPRWKLVGKLIRYIIVSYILLTWFGHWAVLYILIDPLIGLTFHIYICRQHDINWRTVEPRERYIALMEKFGKGDFTPL